jgi:hypothetical protein
MKHHTEEEEVALIRTYILPMFAEANTAGFCMTCFTDNLISDLIATLVYNTDMKEEEVLLWLLDRGRSALQVKASGPEIVAGTPTVRRKFSH